jgi:hypothetical protein
MAWKISLQRPSLSGPHSLGPSLVLFGPDGTVTTEEEDAALKAQEFPDFFAWRTSVSWKPRWRRRSTWCPRRCRCPPSPRRNRPEASAASAAPPPQ